MSTRKPRTEEQKKARRQRYAECPEKDLVNHRKWYAANRKAVLAARRKLYMADPQRAQKAKDDARKWRIANPERYKENIRRWRAARPNYVRDRARRRKYGLSIEDYNSLHAAQEGLCAICRKEAGTDIDHDHNTGTVRGLLCTRCNLVLGQALDNSDTLLAAALYLERHK